MPPISIALYRSFRPSVPEVWPYLSRPDLLARWLGATDLELIPDGEFRASFWNGDAAQGRVLSAVPPNKLDLRWKAYGIGPDERVRLRLEHDGPGSRINVSHEGIHSESERKHARAWWKAALGALHAALHDDRDAHEWGAGLPIVVREPLGRSAADVWPLLSTEAGLEKWVAHSDVFEAVVGGAFRFTSRYQGREVVEEGRIEALDPGKLAAFSWEWRGEGWGAPTRLELALEPDPHGVSVVLAHLGFDLIAEEKRLAARRNYAAAWPEVLENLRRLVAPVVAA
jgi:uncharacterized protein YndB with AHSA1/START domain